MHVGINVCCKFNRPRDDNVQAKNKNYSNNSRNDQSSQKCGCGLAAKLFVYFVLLLIISKFVCHS